MRIAIVEDDASQADLVRIWLVGAGHACHTFGRGREFMRVMTRDSFDLLVLDWELPDVNGDAILAWVRANVRDPVPLHHRARRGRRHRPGAQGRRRRLPGQAVAQAGAAPRASGPKPRAAEHLRVGVFDVDVDRRVVTRHGTEMDLTQKDFDLAVFLFRNVGNLVSRGHILESVWGRTSDLNTRTVVDAVTGCASSWAANPGRPEADRGATSAFTGSSR